MGVALVQVILSGILWHEGPSVMVSLLGFAAILARRGQPATGGDGR